MIQGATGNKIMDAMMMFNKLQENPLYKKGMKAYALYVSLRC